MYFWIRAGCPTPSQWVDQGLCGHMDTTVIVLCPWERMTSSTLRTVADTMSSAPAVQSQALGAAIPWRVLMLHTTSSLGAEPRRKLCKSWLTFIACRCHYFFLPEVLTSLSIHILLDTDILCTQIGRIVCLYWVPFLLVLVLHKSPNKIIQICMQKEMPIQW